MKMHFHAWPAVLRRMPRLLGLLVLLAWAGPAARAEEVLVSAAASLTNVMKELASEFTSQTQGVTITFNFGATGQLQKQIEQGAPVQLFAGAAPGNLRALDKAGLLADNGVRIMARNVMVLALRPGLQLEGPSSFTLLLDPEVKRIAIGQPATVPAGKYAVELLEKMGLKSKLESRFVYAENVRQALTWVEMSEVDAALVYGTDAKQSGKVPVVATTKPEGPPLIEYAVALTKLGEKSAGAKAFSAFLAGPQGTAALQRHGFLPVE